MNRLCQGLILAQLCFFHAAFAQTFIIGSAVSDSTIATNAGPTYSMKGSWISNLPTRNLEGIAPLFPGLRYPNGVFHLRGGRQDEVGFLLEGASVRDIMTGENLLEIMPEALSELQVSTSPHPASMTNAVAGAISSLLRSGGSRLQTTLRIETDRFTSQNNALLNTYSYGYHEITGTVDGPVPGSNDKVRFFMSGQNRYFKDNAQVFWDGFRLEDLVGQTGGKASEPFTVNVKPGNIPEAANNLWIGAAGLDFNLDPITLRIAGAFNFESQDDNLLPIRTVFNQRRIPRKERSVDVLSAKATYQLGSQLDLQLQFNYLDTRGKRYDPVLGDSFMIYADSVANAAQGFQFTARYRPPSAYLVDGFPFDISGRVLARYSKFKQNYWQTGFRLQHKSSWQQLSLGGVIQKYRLRYFNNFANPFYARSLSQLARARPDGARALSDDFVWRWVRLSGINSFGYDPVGGELNTTTDRARRPKFSAVYVNERIGSKKLQMHVGLQAQNYDFDNLQLRNPTNPQFSNFVLDESQFEKAGNHLRFSPSIAISYQSPIMNFGASAGRFFQAPPLEKLYLSRLFLSNLFFPKAPSADPLIAFDFEPVESRQFQLWGQRRFPRRAEVGVAAFVKKTTNQLRPAFMIVEPTSNARGYDITKNGDITSIRGLELLGEFSVSKKLRVTTTLTFQTGDIRQGLRASPGFNPGAPPGALENVSDKLPDYQQSFSGAIIVDYNTGKHPTLKWLKDFSINAYLTVQSGHPYTLVAPSGFSPGNLAGLGHLFSDSRGAIALSQLNEFRTPWAHNLDLRISKNIAFSRVNLTLYVYAKNLFNKRNEINVFGTKGTPLDDPDFIRGLEREYGSRYSELYRVINIEHRQHYWELTGNDIYGKPRQFRFGLMASL